mgnify:CR=1 FL=1
MTGWSGNSEENLWYQEGIRCQVCMLAQAIELHSASLSEVSSYLNRSASALSSAVTRHHHFASLQT